MDSRYSLWSLFRLLPNHQLYSSFSSMYFFTAYGFLRESFFSANCLATLISFISNRIASSLLCTVATFAGDILFFIHFPLFSSFPFGSMYTILYYIMLLKACCLFLLVQTLFVLCLCILDLVFLLRMILLSLSVCLLRLLLRSCSFVLLRPLGRFALIVLWTSSCIVWESLRIPLLCSYSGLLVLCRMPELMEFLRILHWSLLCRVFLIQLALQLFLFFFL